MAGTQLGQLLLHITSRIDPEQEHYLRLLDGRTISYRQFGKAGGIPIVALHGTPGSRLKYRVAHDAAAERGLWIIAPDRWGYGRSSAPSVPTLEAYTDDICELMSGFGVCSFALVGISGGGPFATAMAARMGEKIRRLALIAPVGDVALLAAAGADHADAEAFRQFHRFCFLTLPRIPLATRAVFTFYRLAVMTAPGLAVRLALLRSGPDDKRVMSKPESRRSLGRTFAAGMRHSVSGPVIDLELFSQPWDFDLATIACPTRLWIGEDDRNVPIAAVTDLAKRIPDAQLLHIAEQGHFWISENFGDVLDWLGE